MTIAQMIKHGKKPQGYTLKASDVGKVLTWDGGIGKATRHDIGKRCWYKGYFEIESDYQRDKRRN